MGNLEEDVFALKFELETLSNVLLRSESERWIPNFLYPQTEKSHIDRYNLACNYSFNKKILDVACGSGKGSNILANEGRALSVNAYDIDERAIRYAKHRYKSENIHYNILSAEDINEEGFYDLVVSFETIEHLKDYDRFLHNVRKALKNGGMFLVSTPLSTVDIDINPDNPYHKQEWGFQEFHHEIKKFFSVEKIFVQLYPIAIQNYRNAKKQVAKPLLYKLIERVKRRLNAKPYFENFNHSNFSVIEEFCNQYSIEELSVKNVGYQIVLAKK